jgi:hypothetical protein
VKVASDGAKEAISIASPIELQVARLETLLTDSVGLFDFGPHHPPKGPAAWNIDGMAVIKALECFAHACRWILLGFHW